MNTPMTYALVFEMAIRIRRGTKAITFEQFKEAITGAGGDTKDLMSSFQRLKSNPANWIAEHEVSEQAQAVINILFRKP